MSHLQLTWLHSLLHRILMRRDSIFYRLFQQFPGLLGYLLPTPPADAADYRFDSVAVKEPRFEIDGVFLPIQEPGVVVFCEVQFQRDEQLYERLFGEAFLYFYRNRQRFTDWQAVVIYPSRTVEQLNVRPYQVLLESPQVHRVYLDELGDIEQLPLELALMVLTTTPPEQAPAQARALLNRAKHSAGNRAIIDMVTTIMVYKFTTLSQQEVEQMLGIRLEETRVYQEARAEGRQEGRQEGEQALLLLLLTQKLGTVSEHAAKQISTLSLEQLEALALALLNFSSLADLESWLQGVE